MASIRKLRGKWYSRIQIWDGVRQRERLIPLKTSNKTDAKVRNAEIERVESDIKVRTKSMGTPIKAMLSGIFKSNNHRFLYLPHPFPHCSPISTYPLHATWLHYEKERFVKRWLLRDVLLHNLITLWKEHFCQDFRLTQMTYSQTKRVWFYH